MDELLRLRSFVKVVEAGSFSAAAGARYSTSTVTRQIQSLENDLGVRLIHRSSRGLSLTEPGRKLYARARNILSDLDNAMSEASSYQESVKGVLKVSLRIAAAMVVAPALPDFLAKHPELVVELSLTDERPDLITNHIDVAVWMGHIPNSEIIARKLRPTERVVCASPQYLEKNGTPRTPTDLVGHNCLLYTAPSYGNLWGFSKDGLEQEVEVSGSFRSDDARLLLSGALNGLGVIIAHKWMVSRIFDQGRLCRVLSDYTVRPGQGDADLYLVYPSRRGLSRNVRVFIDFLVDLFQTEPSDGALADRLEL